jgi:hypothetical protein
MRPICSGRGPGRIGGAATNSSQAFSRANEEPQFATVGTIVEIGGDGDYDLR